MSKESEAVEACGGLTGIHVDTTAGPVFSDGFQVGAQEPEVTDEQLDQWYQDARFGLSPVWSDSRIMRLITLVRNLKVKLGEK